MAGFVVGWWGGARFSDPAPAVRGRTFATRMCVAQDAGRREKRKYGIPEPTDDGILRLEDLRESLIRQEETIIFSLVERAQFASNAPIYDSELLPVPGYDGCFSMYLLCELEKVYAKVRRYTSPDEHPFSKNLKKTPMLLELLQYPNTLVENAVNLNDDIWRVYRQDIIPQICSPGDDSNYGSSATCDVACLQALSKRIHYGKFVAEVKFEEKPELYTKLIKDGDRKSIWNELSDFKVEERLLQRVYNKAKAYVQEITYEGALDTYKLQPETFVSIYRDIIIPLTKDVEVEYLMIRV